MALAFDAASTDNGWTTGVSSLTWNHVCTGSNRIVLVGVTTYHQASLITVTGVTYNGVAMTKIASISGTMESSNQSTELWYLIGPATGTQAVVVTLSGTCDFADGSAFSYTDGHQTSPIGASATSQNASSSTTHSLAITTLSDSSWLVGYVFTRGLTLAAGAATSLRGYSAGSETAGADSNGAKTPTGSYSLAYSVTTTGIWPGAITAELRDVSATVGGSIAAISSGYHQRGLR